MFALNVALVLGSPSFPYGRIGPTPPSSFCPLGLFGLVVVVPFWAKLIPGASIRLNATAQKSSRSSRITVSFFAGSQVGRTAAMHVRCQFIQSPDSSGDSTHSRTQESLRCSWAGSRAQAMFGKRPKRNSPICFPIPKTKCVASVHHECGWSQTTVRGRDTKLQAIALRTALKCVEFLDDFARSSKFNGPWHEACNRHPQTMSVTVPFV